MIYDGAIEHYNIRSWLKEHIIWKNPKNNELRALNDDLFRFSRKYLLCETYENFVNIRKKEIIEEKIKNKKIKLSFLRKLTLTKQDLAFVEDSYQYSAMMRYFYFLSRIIIESEKNDKRIFGKDSTHFENAHREFCRECAFIDEKTFYIIQEYAEIYLDWIEEQLKNNPKFKIQEKMRNF